MGGMICSRRLVSISILTNTHTSVEHVLLRPENLHLSHLDRLPRDAAPMTCRLRHFRVHSFNDVFESSLPLIFNASAESLVVLDWQNFVPSSNAVPFPNVRKITLRDPHELGDVDMFLPIFSLLSKSSPPECST
mgnify:FL=1